MASTCSKFSFVPERENVRRAREVNPYAFAPRLPGLRLSLDIIDERAGLIYAGKKYTRRGKREVYTLVATGILRPKDGDPLTYGGAGDIISAVAWYVLCGPKNASTTYSNCVDSAPDTGSTCMTSTYLASINYGSCIASTEYRPNLAILQSAPTSQSSFPANTYYAKGCPIASSAPDLSTTTFSGITKLPNTLLIKGYCYDTTNNQWWVRWSTLDNSTASYTINTATIFSIIDANTVRMLFYYQPSPSPTKGSSDIYYYIYQIAAPYTLS